ncbi:MAG: DUF4340 domain-containing protein [Gammaproteobacteria bacterium]
MSTRALFNLTLVLLTIGLIMIVYYKPGLESDNTLQPITTLDPAQVTDIRITRAERGPLHLVKKTGVWMLAGTTELPASAFQVRALLPLLQASAVHSYSAGSLDLAALGLDPPLATITLGATEIRIGTTESLENKRYAQVGNTVYLIDDRYQHLINADWSNFVSRKLLPANAEITRLQLPDITLTRTADDQWQVDPETADTSADAIQQLIDTWERASALYVRRHANTGADETIRITTGANAEPVTFTISARTPDLILARTDLGIEYHLTDDQGPALLSLNYAETGQEPDPPPSD